MKLKIFSLIPVLFTAFLIFLQAVYFLMLIFALDGLSPYVHFSMLAIGLAAAFFIASGDDSPIYKLAWVIPVLLLPSVFGIVYIFYNRRRMGRRIGADLLVAEKSAKKFAAEINLCPREDFFRNKTDFLTANYIQNAGGFGCYYGSQSEYFPVGEDFYNRFMAELKKAKKFIFIEFFIIKQGKIWDCVLNILEEKIKIGVDVRVIYDGCGSSYTLPYNYYKTVRKKGIKCMVFNPPRPFASFRVNLRNHRKLSVIDGKTAFTCGLNLADNYFNIDMTVDTGHWKDTSIMVKGDAAHGFTLMFLSMWEFLSREKQDYNNFSPDFTAANDAKSENAVCVWSDKPYDCEPLSERLYLNLISRAEKHVYIISPYLVPSNEISAALCLAAKSGADVRIILPFIPDKYILSTVGKSNYQPFLAAGVKIYEYAPGFIHGKMITVDGKRAVLGTANFDFRSLYMHHECGSCFFGGKIVSDMENDFLNTLKSCKEITLKEISQTSCFKKAFRRASRLLSPFI